MTKSNNEWVPEIGQKCDVYVDMENQKGHVRNVEIKYLGKRLAVFEEGGNEYAHHLNEVTFREIKTEAENRRKHLIEEVHDLLEQSYEVSVQAEMLIDAGYIKPNPLTDEVINDIAWKILKETDYVDGIDKMVYVVRLASKELRSKMMGEDL